MKKKSYLVYVTLAIALLVNILAYKQEIVKAGGGVFSLNVSVRAPETTTLTISTSTLNFLTPGTGTTTLQVYTGGANQMDVNIFMQASSTLTDLRWRVEYSHSTSSIPSEMLWYPEVTQLNNTTATTSNQVQTGREYRWLFASTTPHRIGTSTAVSLTFDPNTVSVRTFRISDINARWTRVIFYIPTGSIASLTTLTTALGDTPLATSTNAGINLMPITKEPY